MVNHEEKQFLDIIVAKIVDTRKPYIPTSALLKSSKNKILSVHRKTLMIEKFSVSYTTNLK